MYYNKSLVYIATILVLLVIISACSTPRMIEVSTVQIQRPQLVLPDADQLNMRNVQFVIITEDNYQEVFATLTKNGRQPVLFGLSDNGYEALGLNLSDVRLYIQQQKTIIAAYERYYQKSEEALDQASGNEKEMKDKIDSANESAKPSSRLSKFFGF